MRKIVMPEAKSKGVLTVRRWLKSVGAVCQKGEVLAQIESAEGVMELEASSSGVLSRIVVEAGKSVPAGTVIGELDEKAKSRSSLSGLADVTPDTVFGAMKSSQPAATPAVPAAPAVAPAAPAAPAVPVASPAPVVPVAPATPAAAKVAAPAAAASNSPAVPIRMPQAGNSMEEGTIVKWLVKEGDRISKGQPIFEIETDKANMEVEAPEDGRVAKIVAHEGAVVPVKEAVAYLSEGEVDLAALGVSVAEKKPSSVQAAPVEPAVAAAPTAQPVVSAASAVGEIKASPAARRIAQESGLELASVGLGSGPGGRILSTDLVRASAAGVSASAAAAVAPVAMLNASGVVRKKMSKMRKAIASNLSVSKQTIPHFYLRSTINADAMMSYYRGEKAKYPCSVNDLVTLACAKAIVEFPALRSRIDGDEIVEFPNVNIGIAVGVDDGLTVPVLLNAHTMNLQQIAANTRRIVENARAGKLEGWGEGNFTITNLGMFGVEEFAAIVNPPEPAILAVGAVREAVVVKDGFMKPGKVMTMTLSCDHRIVDGLLAAKFMARVKELLENPSVMG